MKKLFILAIMLFRIGICFAASQTKVTPISPLVEHIGDAHRFKINLTDNIASEVEVSVLLADSDDAEFDTDLWLMKIKTLAGYRKIQYQQNKAKIAEFINNNNELFGGLGARKIQGFLGIEYEVVRPVLRREKACSIL